jgi:hypothetical protein
MFVVDPADTADGAVEFAHAAALTTKQTITARRIVPSVTVNSVWPLTVLSRPRAAGHGGSFLRS